MIRNYSHIDRSAISWGGGGGSLAIEGKLANSVEISQLILGPGGQHKVAVTFQVLQAADKCRNRLKVK